MRFQLELSPDIETRLNEMATQNGLDTAAFVKAVIEEKLRGGVNGAPRGEGESTESDARRHFYHTASPEEWERAFHAIGQGNEHLPVPPPDAFERESLYEDRF